MASISKRINADGAVVYRIRVHGGRNSQGKQRTFQTTWSADPKKSAAANEKALSKFAAAFEAQCKSGAVVEKRVLFGTYCRELIDDKQHNGLIKASTAAFYRGLYPLLSDIDGVPLPEITITVLNRFYKKLLETPTASGVKYRLRPSVDLLKIGDVSNKTKFSQKYNVAVSTLNVVLSGANTSPQTAQKIASALDVQLSKLFISEGNSTTVTPQQVRKVHSLVSMVMAEALKDGLITQNCTDRVRLPKNEKAEPRFLSTDEISALLTAANNEPAEIRLFVFLLVATGCRRGEILGLQWSDVNFQFNQIEIRQAVYYRKATGLYVDTPKNSTSCRFIRLPIEIMELLKEYKAEWETRKTACGLAFPQIVHINDGQGVRQEFTANFLFFQIKQLGLPHAPDTANKWLTSICCKNGLEHINPHSLRHSAASVLIYNGVDPVSIAKFLGHTSPQTTEKIYAHALEESRNRNAEIIGSMMFRNKSQDNKKDKQPG